MRWRPVRPSYSIATSLRASCRACGLEILVQVPPVAGISGYRAVAGGCDASPLSVASRRSERLPGSGRESWPDVCRLDGNGEKTQELARMASSISWRAYSTSRGSINVTATHSAYRPRVVTRESRAPTDFNCGIRCLVSRMSILCSPWKCATSRSARK